MTQTVSEQLAATAAAFDSVAATYDGPQGNNQLIQRMRDIVWERIAGLVETPSTLLDLGCGTGIDAQHFADLGHHVIATDVSPAMVERASPAHGRGWRAHLDVPGSAPTSWTPARSHRDRSI